MVPKSPIEQPIKHHIVLYADFFHTALSDQLNPAISTISMAGPQQDWPTVGSDMIIPKVMGFSIVVYS